MLSMPRPLKGRGVKAQIDATEDLFRAAFGRDMTGAERKRFIFETPLSLAELARRKRLRNLKRRKS
jgi:hypothetical protein